MMSPADDLAPIAARVLMLTQEQARAIESNDWARFERASDERDALQALLDRSGLVAASAHTVELLRLAQATDRVTAALILDLQTDTGLRVRQAHHAQSALQGYERPTRQEMVPIVLDTER